MVRRCCSLILLLACASAGAQTLPISTGEQGLAFDSGEAWAMRYVGASTLFTGFGASPELAAGDWQLGAELGHIPRLDREQQQVGLGGNKQEDLNKSPLFGRARGWIGLPAGWVAELGYSPPVQIDGVRAYGLVSAALGRRWALGEDWSLSTRVLGQHGAARGDITCPAEQANRPQADNPFRCSAPSRDRLRLNYYGLDATLARRFASGAAHLSAGTVRYEPQVQVNAELTQYIERIRLRSSGQMPYFATGWQSASHGRWQIGGELLYVPLTVRRSPAARRASDDFWSLRLSLRWRP